MRRLRARLGGRLREIRPLRELGGVVKIAQSLTTRGDNARRLSLLALAARYVELPALRALLRPSVRRAIAPPQADEWRRLRIGWKNYAGDGGVENHPLTTSLLLKEPGPGGEKGVLYVSFEYNWLRLVALPEVRAFFDRYLLVGASSWSPTDFAVFGNLAGLSPDPAFIGVSNMVDVDRYRLFEPAIRALPLMACDWVDPDGFSPMPREARDIDILMVANWLPFKRHWLLFEALRDMPRDLRVVLVGRNAPGRTEREIREEARAFGVRQSLELLTDIPPERVRELQCRARVAPVLSRREGSCVAITEAMFADTPVVMMRDAHVGSKAHVNDATGILCSRRGLARGLTDLMEGRLQHSPRQWAEANISCHRSSERLNAILRAYSGDSGRPWTRDIAPLCWRYVPEYVHPSDGERLAPAVRDLQEQFGIVLRGRKTAP